MKKTVLSILCILAIIITIILVKISDNNIKKNDILSFNGEFEEYKDKNLYGADIISIINKASDNNKEYQTKEEENYTIKIDITLLTQDKEGNVSEVTYPMERLIETRIRWIYTKFFINSF